MYKFFDVGEDSKVRAIDLNELGRTVDGSSTLLASNARYVAGCNTREDADEHY